MQGSRKAAVEGEGEEPTFEVRLLYSVRHSSQSKVLFEGGAQEANDVDELALAVQTELVLTLHNH